MNPYDEIHKVNQILNLNLSEEQEVFVTDIHNTLGSGITEQLMILELNQLDSSLESISKNSLSENNFLMR